MLRKLSEIRSKGGNFLLNMGPSPAGEMPGEFYAACEELAGWMHHSGESVIGARPGPNCECCNVPVTRRRKKWYLHALPPQGETPEDRPGDKGIRVSGIERPRSVKLLRTGEKLEYDFENGTLRVVLAAAKRTKYVDVVMLRW